MKLSFVSLSILTASALSCFAQNNSPVQSPMNAMDHGPFVSSTIALDPHSTRSIVAHKGIAVRVGVGHDAVVVFDTDLLRVAAAWTGGFLEWSPARDGLQEFPIPDGFIQFSTSQRPGWSLDGGFTDRRPYGYGPIPAKNGFYRGLYLNDDQVVFSYVIGTTQILDSPGFFLKEGVPIFTRTLKIGPTKKTLSLRIAESPDGNATSLERIELSPTSGYIRIRSGPQTRLIGYRGLPGSIAWRLVDRHLAIDLPMSEASQDFELSIGPVRSSSDDQYMLGHLERTDKISDLDQRLTPGPAKYEVLETQIKRGDDAGPFAVDELTVPLSNPWNSFLRFTAVDFLSDGRAVVPSLSGDVWIVDGLRSESQTLRWTRFATGLYQPLGVKVVDDRIYITGRDQITLLHDRNQDGEADYYENFNNQVMASTNFHAFTLNLETDSKGNFYFAKATPWPPISWQGVAAEITPHHGVLFRMPPDGSRLDVVATGLRNPNGLSIGPNDEILYSDNEGNWVPTSKVHRILEGGFHGFMYSAHQAQEPNDFVKPILWVPHFVDNSPSTPIFINSPKWPEELQGQVLLTSYGRGTLSLVLNENVEDQWQAAHLKLPLDFKSGLMGGRFGADGQLYLAGLTIWQSVGHGGDTGSFHRVRHTGKALNLPVAVDTKKGGLTLRFSDALDPVAAVDPENYTLTQWTYPWSSQYGTRGKIYSILNPGQEGSDPVSIESIQLSENGKQVMLSIPGLRQDLVQTTVGTQSGLPDAIDTPMGLVMAIDYHLRSADGLALNQLIHKTIHRLAGDHASLAPEASSASSHAHGSHSIDGDRSVSRTTKPASVPINADRIIEIRATGIALAYDVTQIRAKSGERLAIRLVNASDMAHNVVLVKSESDINPVGIAAINAQEDAFVPKSESHRVIAASDLAYPGDTVMIEFTAPEPGVYPYICTFSGHFTVMQGRLIVE